MSELRERCRAWILAIVGGTLATFLGTYLVFFLPPNRLRSFLEPEASGAQKKLDAALQKPELHRDQRAQAFASNSNFRVFIQYYPSTAASATAVRDLLADAGFPVVHFRGLREGQLRPRASEIIYYSETTKVRAEQLQRLIAQRLSTDLRVARSPYFGDPASDSKLFINVF